MSIEIFPITSFSDGCALVQKRLASHFLPPFRTSLHVSLWNKLPFKSSQPPTSSAQDLCPPARSSYTSLRVNHLHIHTRLLTIKRTISTTLTSYKTSLT
ncbi:hypothetical protein FOXYSP1_01575 [Fusarium oxysporum f. sp. phaseoli]